MWRLLVTTIASEVERVRAPERVSETAAADFLRAVLRRELTGREEVLARAKELSLGVEDGASMIVARAHPQAPTDEGWRGRVRAVAERGAWAVVSLSIAGLIPPLNKVVVHVGGGRTSHLDIDIVAVSLAMARRSHCLEGQIYPPDEGRF